MALENGGRSLYISITLCFLITVTCQTVYPQYSPGAGHGPWYGYYYGQQQQQYGHGGQNVFNPSYNQQPNYYGDQRHYGDQRNLYNAVTLPPSFRYEKPNIDGLPKDVAVNTALGTVTGSIIYLFDSPIIKYRDKPGTQSKPIARVEYNVSAFVGIPYAKPPVKDRRFQPPEKYGFLQNFNAKTYRPICPQPYQSRIPMLHFDFNEDCLYLNIFTPGARPTAGPLLPVMLYIHGGEFESGSGNWFPGHMLAGFRNVIVVTFNYRLGALGFLSTGDEHSPGNYGMLDQAMAIEWVYDQIGYFGGDRKRITLFGPGAGGASAGLHMISPLTRNFIRRVIAQSGSALADWAAITNLEKARNTSRVFGTKLGCPTSSSYRIVECLKTRSFKELTGFSFKAELGFFPWAPIVDRDIAGVTDQHRFLPDTPRTLFLSRHFNPDIEYLCGVTEDDAAYLLLKEASTEIDQNYVNRKVKEYILQYNYTLNPDGVYRAMSFMYTSWADPYSPARIREEYINMMSDALFKAPTDDIVKILLTKQVTAVYMYVLNSTVQGFQWPWWRAKAHDTEYYFLTGAPFMEPIFYPPDKLLDISRDGYTEEDRDMSEFFMTTFSNFAHGGQPTPYQVIGINWRPMVQRPERILYYLNINTTRGSSTERNYRQRESAFWTNYMPTLIGEPPPTTPLPMEEQIEFQVGFYSAIGAAILFFLLTIIGCAMYCSSTRRRSDYYEDDEYLANHTDLSIMNEKNERKLETQQHTTV